jgi:hypothetical protein
MKAAHVLFRVALTAVLIGAIGALSKTTNGGYFLSGKIQEAIIGSEFDLAAAGVIHPILR